MWKGRSELKLQSQDHNRKLLGLKGMISFGFGAGGLGGCLWQIPEGNILKEVSFILVPAYKSQTRLVGSIGLGLNGAEHHGSGMCGWYSSP